MADSPALPTGTPRTPGARLLPSGPASMPGPRARWSRVFPGLADQAPAARHYLASILDGSPLTADALACLGELVNNSVIHSNSRLPGGTFIVHIQIAPGTLRVEVCDNGGPWTPRNIGANGNGGATLDAGGRGLLIVAALASDWDINPKTTAPARTAWFTMGMPCAPAQRPANSSP